MTLGHLKTFGKRRCNAIPGEISSILGGNPSSVPPITEKPNRFSSPSIRTLTENSTASSPWSIKHTKLMQPAVKQKQIWNFKNSQFHCLFRIKLFLIINSAKVVKPSVTITVNPLQHFTLMGNNNKIIPPAYDSFYYVANIRWAPPSNKSQTWISTVLESKIDQPPSSKPAYPPPTE